MLMTIIVLMAASITDQTSGTTSGRELFDDPEFRRGFMLTAASHPAPKEELGPLHFGEEYNGIKPVWRVAQWGTRDLLEPQSYTCVPMANQCWADNKAKQVVYEYWGPGPAGIGLVVHGDFEYDGHMRAAGEAWPHLLIEQRFRKPIVPKDWKVLCFSMKGCISLCKAAPWSEGKLDPKLHTAQVSAFWTVHNVTQGNPDCGDMIWFGIPFFDARYPIPPAYYALDAGKADASGKFICMLDGKRFWKVPTGDGTSQRLKVDLVPLLREALTIAQEHGYLKNTQYEDLASDSFNLGWEIPGPYEAAFDVRGLSLRGEDK